MSEINGQGSNFKTGMVVLGSLLSLFVLAALIGLVEVDLWTFEAVMLIMLFSLEYLPDIVNQKQYPKRMIGSLLFYLIGILPCIYLLFAIPRLEWYYGSDWTTGDIVFGALFILAILKLAHKKFGLAMPLIAAIFLLYVLFGDFLPHNFFGHSGFGFSRTISFMFGPSAIFGTVLNTFARIIILYMLFGAFLQESGVGDYLTELAFAATGRFRGGPAKVAVISSALLGTINGNSVANVATTGAITIPLMKRVGYAPHFAGAVEAVASTGGQILPPVMGAGAFIMAEFLQIKYSTVVIAAAIPAILYYLSVILMVDLEAVRLNLKGIDKNELPPLRKVLKKAYLLLPIFILVYELIVVNASITLSGILAIASTVVVSWFDKDSRMTPRKIINALYNGATDSIGIAAVCATAGVIIGAVSMTGLGTKFSSVVLALAQGNLSILAVLTALICMVLGMGLPTTAAYIITVAVAAPALIKAGIAPLSAHLFVFYYACLSAITPPVAAASYTGASIAKAPVMKTGWTAVKLGIVAYLVPFFFLTNQTLLARGAVIDITRSIITAGAGCALLAIAFENINYNGKKINIVQRILFLIAFVLLLDPGLGTDLIGLAVALVSFIFGGIFSRFNKKDESTGKNVGE